MSAEVEYQAETRTLHVQGNCHDDDCAALRAAVRTFGQLAHDLTIDLIAVGELSPAAADLLAEQSRQALLDGRSINVHAEPGSRVEQAVLAAASRTQRPQAPE